MPFWASFRHESKKVVAAALRGCDGPPQSRRLACANLNLSPSGFGDMTRRSPNCRGADLMLGTSLGLVAARTGTAATI